MQDAETTVELSCEGLNHLFQLLIQEGFELIAPRLNREKTAITLGPIESVDDLPRGYTDCQEPGRYQVDQSGANRFFHFNATPDSWKRYLNPSRQVLWSAESNPESHEITFKEAPRPSKRLAFIGLRGCDLAAIDVYDRVFSNRYVQDLNYQATRSQVFCVAVECSKATSTCFCPSMGTGPEVKRGYDLRLTELEGPEEPFFLAHAGSEAGTAMLAKLKGREARDESQKQRIEQLAAVKKQIPIAIDTTHIRDRMLENLEHKGWQDVADRCLACANCTLACPTCFCSRLEDIPDLTAQRTERVKSWDSCFNDRFSYIHGGEIRPNPLARYRQWLTHKFATWHDQFGTSGCVGCGRCITWCPVGIDVREEVTRMTQVGADDENPET